MRLIRNTDNFFIRIEARIGLFMVALAVGTIMLLLAALDGTPRFTPEFHGNGFIRLSMQPFDLENENDLRFRILSPLLGYLLFFRGESFTWFMLFILALFFSFVYFFSRKRGVNPLSAIVITGLLAFSTLSWYQLYFPAYNDPLSYLLILLCMYFYRRPVLSSMLLALMLFNHENTVFLFPFFFFLMLDGDYGTKRLMQVSLRFIAAVIPYYVFRHLLVSNTVIQYTVGYYFDSENMEWTRKHVLPNLLPGIYHAFKFTWLFVLCGVIFSLIQKRYREFALIVLVCIPVVSQMLIAYDISRLMGLAFPAVLIGAYRCREFLGDERFTMLGAGIIILNVITASYCVGAGGLTPY